MHHSYAMVWRANMQANNKFIVCSLKADAHQLCRLEHECNLELFYMFTLPLSLRILVLSNVEGVARRHISELAGAYAVLWKLLVHTFCVHCFSQLPQVNRTCIHYAICSCWAVRSALARDFWNIFGAFVVDCFLTLLKNVPE